MFRASLLFTKGNRDIRSLKTRFSCYLHTIVAPTLPESIKTGAVSEWKYFPNQYIRKDAIAFVFETLKATIDIYSPVSGKITKQLVEIDQEIIPETPILKVRDPKGFSRKNFLEIDDKDVENITIIKFSPEFWNIRKK